MVFMWITLATLILAAVLILMVKTMVMEIEFFFKKEDNCVQFLFKFILDNYLPFKQGKPLIIKKNFALELPFQFSKMRSVHPLKLIRLIIRSLPDYSKEAKDILKFIKIRELMWVTTIGFANPGLTGISTGALWYLKYLFYRKLLTHTSFRNFKPRLDVIPNFEEQVFSLEFHCIFSFRVGHIIIIIGRTSWHIFRHVIRR